jgi:hypothetical protein
MPDPTTYLRTQRGRARIFAVGVLAMMAACSAASPAPEDAASPGDPLHTTEAALAALTPDWIHPACSPAALLPPNGVDACNGPWSYAYQDTCESAPPRTCKLYRDCPATWGDTRSLDEIFGTFVWSCTTTCTGGGGGGGGSEPIVADPVAARTCTTRCNGPGIPQNHCRSLAAQRASDWKAHYTSLGAPQVDAIAATATTVVISEDPPGSTTFSTFFNCQIHITQLPTQNTGPRPECGCEDQGPPTCTPSNGAVEVVTAPGLLRPAAPAAPAGTTRTLVSQPSCMTCDQIPSSDVAGKYACLNDGIGAATARPDLRRSLIARLKLLFQLAGEQLTPAQRSNVEAYYEAEPEAGPACSAAVPWSSTCTELDATIQLASKLQLCSDLVNNPASSTAVRLLALPACLDHLRATTQLSESCRLPMLDAADQIDRELLTVTQPQYGDLATALPPVLRRLHDWWSAAQEAAIGDQAWLADRASRVLRGLWARIHRDTAPLPTSPLATEAAATALLADVHAKGLPNDIAVLSALFAPGAALPASPLLLALTGDSLDPLADRLARLALIHDVGCRFAACGTSPLRTSATSELVRALAALVDPVALAAALAPAATPHLRAQQPAVYEALVRVQAQHGRLGAAWDELRRSEPLSALPSLAEPPAEAATLAAVVRAARRASASYQASGQFMPWLAPRLTSGVLQQGALVAEIDRLTAEATAQRRAYEDHRLATVNDLIAQNQATGITGSLHDRVRAHEAQKLVLIKRRIGLEAREDAEQARIAQYQTAFEALIARGVLDANAAYQQTTLTTLRPTGADAHFPIGATQPQLSRDRFAVVAMDSGESLRIQVSDTWSPICAVRNAQLRGPGGPVPISIDNADVETGPRGFWVNLESSGFKNRTFTAADSEAYGIAAEVCLGGSLEALPIGSGKLCGFYNNTHTETTSNGSGRQSSLSANFATGIRLPNTPYPVAPAGSLVAVITPRGQPDTVLDVRVVSERSVVIAPNLATGPGAIDVHFVVNDLAQAGCTPSSSALTIEMAKVTPVGNVARALGRATTDTLAALAAQAPAILAQGQLTGAELAALRAAAWVAVQTRLPAGTSLAGLPYDLRQLFDAVLEAQLASLARRAEIHATTVERDRIDLELSTIGHELEIAAEHNRLLYLIPRWRLRALQGSELSSATATLAEALTSYVAPVFELRDPAALTNFRTTASAALQKLIDLNVTAPLEDAVRDLEVFSAAARTAISASQFELPTTGRQNVVVAIPRDTTWTGPFRRVSATAADRFWAATNAHGTATIAVTPSDLYGAQSAAAQLVCGDLGAVVRRAALYVETQASGNLRDFNFTPACSAAAAGAPVVFPVAGKDVRFEIADLLGAPMRLPAMSGNNATVFDAAHFGSLPDALTEGAGISPFTSFRIDMGFTANPNATDIMDNALAVYLVFEVERRASNQRVVLPGICDLPPPPPSLTAAFAREHQR